MSDINKQTQEKYNSLNLNILSTSKLKLIKDIKKALKHLITAKNYELYSFFATIQNLKPKPII